MKFALITIASMASFAGQLYANSLTINCNNLGGLTESLSVVQTESQTTVSIKSLKAKELLEKLLGEKSISGLVTRLDFSIPRSCKISQENALSFYCPAQGVTLTFSGDQVIDVRSQDIGFGTHNRQTIAPTYREESVIAGLSIYTNPQPVYPMLSTTFLVHEGHSGELSSPSKSIIGKKCSISSN
jgi:hypothetical protein